MNWRRGFFRLWVVATLVWCAVLFVLTRPDKDRFMPWAPSVTIKMGDATLRFPHDADRSVIVAAVAQQELADREAEQKKCAISKSQRATDGVAARTVDDSWWCDLPLAETPDQAAERFVHERNLDDTHRAEMFIVSGILPPLGTLFVGALLAWALAGFRTKDR